MQGDVTVPASTSMKVPEADVKAEAPVHKLLGRGKGWQYSDHMENVHGYLMKYTNLVTGWQYRFFVLNNEAGLLEYFVNEQSRNQKPRGTLQLAGAVISPSDEDSHTFTVNPAIGEQYKLRATDAKERQHWVSRLQICTQHHTEAIGKNNPPLKSRSFSLASPGNSSPGVQRRASQSAAAFFGVTHHKGLGLSKRSHALQPDHLVDVREMMNQAEGQHKDLVRTIEGLPPFGEQISALDQDMLMLKATTMATMNCLNDCFHILQLQQAAYQRNSFAAGATIEWLEPKLPLLDHLKNGKARQSSIEKDQTKAASGIQPVSEPCQSTRKCPCILFHHFEEKWSDQLKLAEPGLQENALGNKKAVTCPLVLHCNFSKEPERINPDEEIEDTFENNEEDDLGVVEEQRSVILHLLSQLKLGMDLTRVVLPTFILEKRSLLEMYADFMSHPDLFIAITDGATPEERMICFVEYYLTSFHEGRKGAIAKKPYNPIIGETFHCSWNVPKTTLNNKSSNTSSQSCQQKTKCTDGTEGRSQSDYHLRFVAEQVSHHPPVSGFYVECEEKNMCANTHVWTKSKFMGMSIGVVMIGEGLLCLLEHGEEYTFTLPCAYARSILTVPWVELGGKVNVNCAKTGYSAAITFHTKPFYGGKLHRVTAEVKHNATNTVVCRVQGEWNGLLEFTYNNGNSRTVDVTKLPVTKKRVRPIEKQGPFESRRLWQHVTEALEVNNIDKATEYKSLLEERQRSEARHRTETQTPWETKYFHQEGDGWIYYKPLWRSTRDNMEISAPTP
ncbi:oxysterol-binding protein-related protein 11 isoform X1 [Chiloscyllium plagiosum]|uniref:oxysterol-binding protein-related protein 11 isoform X1 n=1 Tax=Chiloscyllium plagiosum TaxID=36176 RepID=UPI001CB7D956|nr:oxysterol-binding protein-related protein 11 isoform X1 [Chiloscyllium plagiosum]